MDGHGAKSVAGMKIRPSKTIFLLHVSISLSIHIYRHCTALILHRENKLRRKPPFRLHWFTFKTTVLKKERKWEFCSFK